MKRRTGDSASAPGAKAARTLPSEASPRLVASGEHSAGFVGFDELGRPRWSWMNELIPVSGDTEPDDVLKALDTDALSLVDEPGAAPARRIVAKDKGYDPYDTARVKVGDRFRRR
ncbi:MAG TPA: hypothetical protein VF339_00190 [Gammaproteobacteria bacterium]